MGKKYFFLSIFVFFFSNLIRFIFGKIFGKKLFSQESVSFGDWSLRFQDTAPMIFYGEIVDFRVTSILLCEVKIREKVSVDIKR